MPPQSAYVISHSPKRERQKSIRVSFEFRTHACIFLLSNPLELIQTFRSVIQAKLWNIRQCKLLFSLVGHNGCVFCVDLDDTCKRAFSGSGDRVSNET